MVSINMSEYISNVVKVLRSNGISNFVVSINDPTNDMDYFHEAGSVFWRRGVANEIESSCDEDTENITEVKNKGKSGPLFSDRFSNQS